MKQWYYVWQISFGRNYFISPDYFGSIRELLQEKCGCPIMVIQGSAGNIASKYFNSAETQIDARGAQYSRSSTALEDMAAVVWEKLSQRIALIEVADTFAFDMYSRERVCMLMYHLLRWQKKLQKKQ